MAAGMGEPSCETIVDGVRITVHVPFEGPLNRSLAHQWISPRSQFIAMHIFHVQDGVEPLPANWEKLLKRLNKGGKIPKGRMPLLRILGLRFHPCQQGSFQSLN